LVYENSSMKGKFDAEKRELHETHAQQQFAKPFNMANRESRKREHPTTTDARRMRYFVVMRTQVTSIAIHCL